MGQKSSPTGLRLGIVKDWQSKYFASSNKEWSAWIVQDKKIRKHLVKYNKEYAIGTVIIERVKKEINIKIRTAKVGAVLGQEGSNIKKWELELAKIIKDKNYKIRINVEEIKNPDLDANVIANEIAVALESRMSFRIAQKRVIRRVMRSGAKGIKTQVSGRLNGVDMARTEGYSEGVVPLQTFRNDIDYAIAEAHTTYGVLGVKVWISRGEVLKGQELKEPSAPKRREFKPRGQRPDYNKKPSSTTQGNNNAKGNK
ncbi:MAG: 30S ribosomal protein S3 [Mycoplasmataceae bacterium]|nr:30S ribosomal protein S3 [Mycoplasmataceae bacterium]